MYHHIHCRVGFFIFTIFIHQWLCLRMWWFCSSFLLLLLRSVLVLSMRWVTLVGGLTTAVLITRVGLRLRSSTLGTLFVSYSCLSILSLFVFYLGAFSIECFIILVFFLHNGVFSLILRVTREIKENIKMKEKN